MTLRKLGKALWITCRRFWLRFKILATETLRWSIVGIAVLILISLFPLGWLVEQTSNLLWLIVDLMSTGVEMIHRKANWWMR